MSLADGETIEKIEPEVQIGGRLRQQRKLLRLTLDQVAGAAGLTKGFLSDIERDRTSPSMASLLRLCKVLGLSVSTLFEIRNSNIVRLNERVRINFGATESMVDYQITPGGIRRLLSLWSNIHPGGSTGDELYSLACEEEMALVLSGELVVQFEQESHLLNSGDTITFDPRRLHTFRNPSQDRDATVLFVLTPPPQ